MPCTPCTNTRFGQVSVVSTGNYPTGADAYEGKMVWDASTDRIMVYTGSAWVIVGGSMPRVEVARSTPQSLATAGSGTAITWDTETFDTDGIHAASSSRFTIPTGLGGRWRFDAGIDFAANATGTRAAWFLKNGAGTRWGQFEAGSSLSGTNNVATILTRELVLVAGDYVEIVLFQSSGGPLNVINNSTTQFFGAQYVGPS